MDQQLLTTVKQRVKADAGLDPATVQMITAVCTDTPLEQADQATWPDPTASADQADTGAGVFLAGVTVEGFRGVGERRHLEIKPGPGLTLLVGRNGSGKSSFAEGLEMCLTGTSTRWSGKTTAWKETWRNLHQGEPSSITVDLVGVDGQQHTLTHDWPAGETDVTNGTTKLDDGRSLADLGWTGPLAQYRPLLSFNELGGILDGRPIDLYNTMAKVLGVEPLREAVEVLRQVRLADSKPAKAVKDAQSELVEELRASADERAGKVLNAIDGKDWDLPAALAAIEEDSTQPTSDLARLRSIVGLDIPHPVDANEVAGRLREADAGCKEAAATDAGSADRTAVLLRQALECVEHDGPMPCPLCGSGAVLDEDWRATATAEAERLAEQAQVVRQAEAGLKDATQRAHRLLPPVPANLEAADLVGLDASAALRAWHTLLDAPDDTLALADHLEAAVAQLDEHVTVLRQQASANLDARQEDWEPLANHVRRWVDDARSARKATARAEGAGKAEKWLAGVARDIEDERFQPIRTAVQSYWGPLRLESNVELRDVGMSRSGNRRSLDLDVAVDDSKASALGVMSQGELHSLALSIFLPRATSDLSPFRFLVLDDPVQAMDPARVDGLAGVLQKVAETRQVVVMTHDTRLPDAVRRLQIPATVWEAHRHPRSRVELRFVEDPVSRYLDDARAIVRSQSLAAGVRARLVAQMGRGAIEAASMEIVRRRRLARGDAHMVVDRLLDDVQTHDLVALALFDAADKQSTARVYPALGAWFNGYVDVLKDCKRGTHVGDRTIDDDTFVRHLDGLVKKLRQEAPA